MTLESFLALAALAAALLALTWATRLVVTLIAPSMKRTFALAAVILSLIVLLVASALLARAGYRFDPPPFPELPWPQSPLE